MNPHRPLRGRIPLQPGGARPLHPGAPGSSASAPAVPVSLDEIPSFEYHTRCRVIRKLAEGGMGAVYYGEQLGEAGFTKPVAIKVIKPELLQKPSTLQMFLDEAKLVAELVHPNIVQVYNLGVYRGLYFVVMEFLHGKTLTDYRHTCLKLGCLPPDGFSAFIVSRVCRGLEYAHTKRDRNGFELGIVHRDVTPSNIMMDFRGAVKLTDFGIAKALTTNMPDETQIVMGKYSYMSPEHVLAKGTDPRSDIFALGLVLHELLTGTRVYKSSTRAELIALMRQPLHDPRARVPDLPAALCEICMKALIGDPAGRFQTAGEFGDALERYLYSGGYGPTNEKLAKHMFELWPDEDRDVIKGLS